MFIHARMFVQPSLRPRIRWFLRRAGCQEFYPRLVYHSTCRAQAAFSEVVRARDGCGFALLLWGRDGYFLGNGPVTGT